ncbi:MAG: ABC transporter ATP-binding protein [Lachnospiraceae bacterium]|nr:ABC transporter ATP-binding protein [Lachnospiraceae bacterium]
MKSENSATLTRVLKLIRPYRWLMGLSLLFAVITVVTTLYAPVLTGQAIDHVVAKGNVDFKAITPILVRFLVVVGIMAASSWMMNLCNNRIAFHVVKDLRTKVYAHVQNLPLAYLDSHSNGDTLSRIVTDIDQLSDGLLMGFSQLFTGVVTIAATLGFMLSIHVGIALLVVLLTPVSLFVAAFIAKRTYSLFRAQSQVRAEMTSLVEELVGNQRVVTAFNYEEKAEERFCDVNHRLQKVGLKAIFLSSLTNPCTRFVNGLVYTGVGIFGGFVALTAGPTVLSVGQLSCFLSYANQYTKPFNEISSVITELQNALASAKRVFDLLDEPEQLPDKENAVVLNSAEGTVELTHVAFSYVPEVPLLKDVTLFVKPGQRVAIVGPTGCGKTTLINLLMRFYDVNKGMITVDGTDVRDLTRESLRGNFGMVLQETWLKAGTIAENIAYGRPDATMEEIEEAAKASYAHNFIRRLKDGYQTVIAEDGGNLSQGQKQLLCIARVMLCLPPMLILDEATSSIDTRMEVRIQRAFHKMMKGRTSFIVAHRLSTIREADMILVMKDGDIIEQGTHEELLAKGGFYRNLYYSGAPEEQSAEKDFK